MGDDAVLVMTGNLPGSVRLVRAGRAGGFVLCGPELVVDARGLEFIDQRRLLVLAEQARRTNATIVLRTTWAGVGRMVEIFGVEGVQVEPLA
ncbi:MAG: hypothetical protein JO115_03205 [Pseudonocardiales bacterium]|nr:hypothetical protein [Pseudonocardiales bacterium]